MATPAEELITANMETIRAKDRRDFMGVYTKALHWVGIIIVTGGSR